MEEKIRFFLETYYPDKNYSFKIIEDYSFKIISGRLGNETSLYEELFFIKEDENLSVLENLLLFKASEKDGFCHDIYFMFNDLKYEIVFNETFIKKKINIDGNWVHVNDSILKENSIDEIEFELMVKSLINNVKNNTKDRINILLNRKG